MNPKIVWLISGICEVKQHFAIAKYVLITETGSHWCSLCEECWLDWPAKDEWFYGWKLSEVDDAPRMLEIAKELWKQVKYGVEE